MKNSSNTIGNQTRDLPACSAVPKQTAPTVLKDAIVNINMGRLIFHIFFLFFFFFFFSSYSSSPPLPSSSSSLGATTSFFERFGLLST